MPDEKSLNISREMFNALTGNEQKLRFLVRYAVFAPSSHNKEPWNFTITNNTIRLIPDLSRALEISDVEHRQLHISMGVALENILIAAAYFGYSTHVTYLIGSTAGTEDLDIECTEKAPSTAENDTNAARLIEAILRPQIHRGEYKKDLPDSVLLAELHKMSNDSVRLDIITEPAKRGLVADLIIQAEIAALDDPEFQKQLAHYLKKNTDEPPLGMAAFDKSFLAQLAPLVGNFFNINRFREKADRALLIEHTPIFVVISTSQDTPEYWVKAGQMFERFALEAADHHMSTDPMTAAIQIGESSVQLQKILGIPHVRPQFFFRLGYPKGQITAPRAHT